MKWYGIPSFCTQQTFNEFSIAIHFTPGPQFLYAMGQDFETCQFSARPDSTTKLSEFASVCSHIENMARRKVHA